MLDAIETVDTFARTLDMPGWVLIVLACGFLWGCYRLLD